MRGGMLAVLVLAATGCSSPSKTATPAAVASAQTAQEVAALRKQAQAGDAARLPNPAKPRQNDEHPSG